MTAVIVGTSRNTVNAYFQEFRQLIFHETLKESGLETGEFELDESYFGAKWGAQDSVIEIRARLWVAKARRKSVC